MSVREITLWKEPKQARSRARVADITKAARQLIGKQGLDGFTMQDVGELAGVAAGTLYQFFPDRNALVAKLFSELLDETDRCVAQHFSNVTSVADLAKVTPNLVQSLYSIARKETAYVEIWHALQAIPAIRHIEDENSRKNAEFLFDILRPLVHGKVNDERLQSGCLLVCGLLSAVVQMALKFPDNNGHALVNEYDVMVRTYLADLTTAKSLT